MAQITYKTCIRQLHTSLCCNSKNSPRAMKKLMGSTNKKKHKYSDTPILRLPNLFSNNNPEKKHVGDSRRASVLNKLFMRHITDLMATGPSASEFVGHGVEINKVKVNPDYRGIRVYWIAKNTNSDEITQKLLQDNAGVLRHELSQLRVMGEVPKITFVKDHQYATLLEIDSRLSRADFGDDHNPVDLADKLKAELELYTPLDNKTREKLNNFEKETEEEVNEKPLPPMVQNLMGLNHLEIMNRVKKQMKKSEALHRLSSDSTDVTPLDININPVRYLDEKSERAAFKEFLTKRQLMQSKFKKREKNYTPDIQYIQEELTEASIKYFDNMDALQNQNDEDYIEDDVEQNEIK